MNASMTTLRKNLIIAMSVLGMGAASLTVHAQEAAASAPAASTKMQHDGQRGQHRAGNPAERMAKYQARLHDKLKLTAAQEPAWTTFTAANAPKKPMGDWKARHAAMAKLSAPERMEQWIAMSKERIASQESRLASLKTFYAVLTPEQKKVFDDSVPGGKDGEMRGHHRGHGAHHKAG
ncbi:LTXXQ motif family protein [Janthinobacterium sp. 35]|uniref:Spy/CpxP family protein refolding chaperone n=1 Tax=unclassified Janthinobacterium TaxID=2610881 RepID=UPI000C5E549B|nr:MULTISPECIES: Spy/CpxP family protein refolding chaperone [unclassified Janthinobacterium]PIG27714.1 LTXXQ motif family protein [Janthinobacterium sp. 35]PVX34163.1 LTXXQ motif family protein [Janthinobacterium sp. 78]